MQYISHYSSPLGNILLAADETGLTGLWFEGQKYFALYLDTVSYTHLDVYKRQPMDSSSGVSGSMQ